MTMNSKEMEVKRKVQINMHWTMASRYSNIIIIHNSKLAHATTEALFSGSEMSGALFFIIVWQRL